MTYFYSLILYSPKTNNDLSFAPADVVLEVKEAGRAMNYGLLVGELLGVDTAKAIDLLTEVEHMTMFLADDDSDTPKLLLDADIAELLNVFLQSLAALNDAIDEQGFPKGPGGHTLANSAHVQRSEDGRLYIAGEYRDLLELRSDIIHLCRFFQFAIDHGFWLKIE